MIISVTERQTYMRCRQAWDWGSFNREAWTPIIAKPALAIGHLWHSVQAEWSLHPDLDPNEIVKDLANIELDNTREAYLQAVGAPVSEMELGPVYDQMGLVMAMVKNYQEHWRQPLPEGFTMVAPEQTCVVPIPGTQHQCDLCKGEGQVNGPLGWDACPACPGTGTTQHYLEGTLDGLIADEYGRVYVLERKTYGQRPKIEVLNMQDQFLAYLWILRALNLGPVGGIAYDGAWKRKEPPRGSTLGDLFTRVRLNRNANELDNFEIQLTMQANEMANNPPIYLNRRWDGCWDCDMVEPCIAKLRGEDWRFILNAKYTQRPKSEDNARELKYAEATA